MVYTQQLRRLPYSVLAMSDLTSLVYIDMTISTNSGNSSAVKWKNSEVLEMLRDIRTAIIADIEPQLTIEGAPE